MNFSRAIRHYALTQPNRLAVADPWRQLTYGQLWEAVRRAAWMLWDKRVRSGDRVLVISRNRIEFVVLYLATLHTGAVLAPVNYRLSSGEIDQLIDIVDPALVVIERETERDHTPEAMSLTDVSDAPALAEESPAAATLADPNVILFTSGTTGVPKGATLTHGNVWNSCANVAHHSGSSPEERNYVVLPLYHTAGLHLQLTPTLYTGGLAVLAPSWHPSDAAATLAEYDITSTFLLPEQWREVCAILADQPLSMRWPLTGSYPVPTDVLDAIERTTGTAPAFIMGMTEVSPQALCIEPAKMREKNGAAGRPTLWSDVRILDDEGNDVAPGEVGEMAFRGPLVMCGYWGMDPLVSKEYFRGGDLARKDEDGYITIVDRKKDIIRSGGETVFSAEVERILVNHPAVQEVCVIGLPDSRWGEGVTAVIVPQEGQTVTLEAVQDFCKRHIASYKKPVKLELLTDLPKTATGKIRKQELRTRLARGEGAG